MKVLTVCGSGKYKPLIHGICRGIADKGFIVLAPPLHTVEEMTVKDDTELGREAGFNIVLESEELETVVDRIADLLAPAGVKGWTNLK
jgi:dienelactone hydrolase